ncbi:hypothetical protein PENSPDRAFT_691364 [Peniophora sp. CONT]|nr:hypothetical protein PENSPDRAFT_691364 [Peniophora sp. CONT]
MGNNAVNNVTAANGLFAGQAPLLRHFFCNLHSVALSWDAPYISQLRSLVICCRTGLPFLREFVDTALRRLHQVEWLDLAYLPLPDTGVVDARSPPVELPYLRRLGLQGSSDNIASVFQHLRFPSTASVELRSEDTTIAEVSRLFPAINSQFSGKDHAVPMTLSVNIDGFWSRGQHRAHISAWPTMPSINSFDIELDPNHAYNSRPSSILLTFDGGDDRVLLETLVRDTLPFSRATCLRAASNSHLPVSAHSGIFSVTPRIETLDIGRWDIDRRATDCHRKLKIILSALLQSARAVHEGRVSPDLLMLPKLQEIRVSLDVPGTWHPHTDETSANESTMGKLRELVVKRAAVGAPLRAIRIVDDSLKAGKPQARWRGDFDPPEVDPVTVPDEVRALLEI